MEHALEASVSAVCSAGLAWVRVRYKPGLWCVSVVRITCPASPLSAEFGWCIEQNSSLT